MFERGGHVKRDPARSTEITTALQSITNATLICTLLGMEENDTTRNKCIIKAG